MEIIVNAKRVAQNTCDRTIKIQQLIRTTRWDHTKVPEIRMSGAWLEKLGFHAGEHIDVHATEGKLVLLVKS